MNNLLEKTKFDEWNLQKQNIHTNDKRPFFRAGEVRWAYLGKNIGTESIGKGDAFSHPVLILTKVFGNSAIAFPLTSKSKDGSYYFNFSTLKGTKHCALLTQIRYLDGKRIREKISSISETNLFRLQQKYFAIIKNRPSLQE